MLAHLPAQRRPGLERQRRHDLFKRLSPSTMTTNGKDSPHLNRAVPLEADAREWEQPAGTKNRWWIPKENRYPGPPLRT